MSLAPRRNFLCRGQSERDRCNGRPITLAQRSSSQMPKFGDRQENRQHREWIGGDPRCNARKHDERNPYRPSLNQLDAHVFQVSLPLVAPARATHPSTAARVDQADLPTSPRFERRGLVVFCRHRDLTKKPSRKRRHITFLPEIRVVILLGALRHGYVAISCRAWTWIVGVSRNGIRPEIHLPALMPEAQILLPGGFLF